jgi:hypothetical protein
MGRGRLTITLAGLLAAALLAAPAAAARTLAVEDRTLFGGEQVRVSGVGWGTTVGVCAADPIELRLVRHRRSWPLARVGGFHVAPLWGAFARVVEIPREITPGAARVVATQREHHLSGFACAARPPVRLDVPVIIHHDASSACREPQCTPYEPAPRLGVEFLGDPVHPAGAFYAALPESRIDSPSGCDQPPCMKLVAAQAEEPRPLRPGTWTTLFGDLWEIPDECPQRVRFRILDRSGTGMDLGAAAVDAEGRFRQAAAIPESGLAPGPGTVSAATDSRDVRCALVATAPVDIRPPPTRVWTLPPAAQSSPDVVRVRGIGWGTDRCDRAVEIVLRGARGRVLRRVRPERFGAFEADVRLPAKAGSGAALEVRQARQREYAGTRGLARRSRCGKRIAPRAAVPKPFPATLLALHEGAELRIGGFGWAPGGCERPEPVTVELVHDDGSARVLAVLQPRKDAIHATVALGEDVKLGAHVRATQPPCGAGGAARVVSTSTRRPAKAYP